MRHALLRCVLPLLLITACVHSVPEQAADDQEAPAKPPATAGGTLITQAEIEDSRAVTAYDAIMKLHGNFLSNRGSNTILGNVPPLPIVFVDGVEYGPSAKLKDIQANAIYSIRLYRAWESAKFGSGKTGGVIEIITKTQ